MTKFVEVMQEVIYFVFPMAMMVLTGFAVGYLTVPAFGLVFGPASVMMWEAFADRYLDPMNKIG